MMKLKDKGKGKRAREKARDKGKEAKNSSTLPQEAVDNCRGPAIDTMEPLRRLWGSPITISACYP